MLNDTSLSQFIEDVFTASMEDPKNWSDDQINMSYVEGDVYMSAKARFDDNYTSDEILDTFHECVDKFIKNLVDTPSN